MTSPYADSTVAITVHNVLATFGGPMNASELLLQTRQMGAPGLGKRQFDVVLHKLARMRLIRRTEVGFMAADPKRRIIVGRSRSDMRKSEDGRWTGGWGAWIWKEPNGTISRVFRERKR